MSEKKRKVVSSLLFAGFIFFNATTSARPLRDDERARLYSDVKSQRGADITIDATYTKETVTRPESVNKKKQEMDKLLSELSEKMGQTLKFSSFGLTLPDGSEVCLSETRTRIGFGLKVRNDTTVFANKEMTEPRYQATTIDTGYENGKDSPSYEIDHKLKKALIWNGKRWSGLEVRRFGRVDETIAWDTIALCNPNRSQNAKVSKNKKFSYKVSGNFDGNVVDEIECVDPNGRAKYSISLDSNDWSICRKIVRYDEKSGLVSQIVEYKQFANAEGTGEPFPRLVIRRHFGKEGREEKVETISVTNVVIGQPISKDIFKLDVPDNYTIIDNRYSPPLTTQPSRKP
jgi:hypothetical protein